jgi:N-acetylglucosamine-6-sulfatase
MAVNTNETSRPHVVVIYLDDLDKASFDLLLARNKLPNIQNRLIAQGTRLSQAFATNPACCPARASFLTGQYTHNHGVETVQGVNGGYVAFHDCLSGQCQGLNRPTLATWLSAAGYYTGFIGKYMNGYANFYNQVPAGWDHWDALRTPGDGYDLRPNNTAGLGKTYTIYQKQPNGGVVAANPPVYQTKYLGDRALGFLNEWAGSGHEAFFLWLAPVPPHVTGDGLEYREGDPHPQFQRRVWADRPGWRGYCDQMGGLYCAAGSLRVGGDPDGMQPLPGYDLPSLAKPSFNLADCPQNKPPWICEHWQDLNQNENLAFLRRLHLDRLESILSLDAMVGALFAGLEAQAILDDTLVILTSDNGFYLGEFRLGNKQHPHEESIGIPMVVRRPGQVQAGQPINRLVLNEDLAPTILDYAGLAWADPAYGVDGRSLRPLLQQEAGIVWRKRLLVEHRYPRGITFPPEDGWLWDIPDYGGVRTEAGTAIGGNQLYVEHYVAFADRTGNVQYVEHYDMNRDPYQTANQWQNPLYDWTRVYLSSALGRLRIAQGQGVRAIEDEPAPLANALCSLLDAVTIKNMYNSAGQLTHFRQHVYAGGNSWYRDSSGLTHVWGGWRMLSLAEVWGSADNHPPVADLDSAVFRDWYDAAGNPTSVRQIFYKKDAGANGEDVWFRNFANPQIPWYVTPWFALKLDDIPWLGGGKRMDAAVFRPMFEADGRIRNIRQIFYVNADRAYYYRDSRRADGSYDPLGVSWPAEWQQGSYEDWASHVNHPPTDRLDAVDIPIISADKRMRQLFYVGDRLWWRDSGPNGAGFPHEWHSVSLEDHVKMGWPLQPTYPRPPFSCTLPSGQTSVQSSNRRGGGPVRKSR